MTARDELLARLVAEQHNGGGWATPPAEWNAVGSTAVLLTADGLDSLDNDVTQARRRREALAEWETQSDQEASA